MTGERLANHRAAERLPTLWAGPRRLLLLALAVLGAAMGAVSVVLAWQGGKLLGGFSASGMLLVLVLAGLFGVGKFAERVLAEKLAQHYAGQLRLGLLRHALCAPQAPALGITVARSTNDLSAVRTWLTQGLVPLACGLPLLAFILAGLWVADPLLVLALAVPLLLELLLLRLLAPGAFATARTLRRHRGAMAARIADTVAAAEAISAAGGVRRELERLDASAQKVAQAAVHRARYAGALRATALSVPLAGSGLVVALGSVAGLDAAAVASALLLVGAGMAVLGDFGRMVEYRQNYRAARRILGPLLDAEMAPDAAPGREQRLPQGAVGDAPRQVRIELGGGYPHWPVLLAKPGERIELQVSEAQTGQILRELATGRLGAEESGAGIWVSGEHLARIEERRRRKLLGAALESMVPERGSVLRALRYRRPQAAPERVLELAEACGLDLAELPAGERTGLRRAGQPLTAQQRAALLVARALLDKPPLLVIDRIVGQLEPAAAARVTRWLNRYPGVVLYAGPLAGVEATGRWRPNPEADTEQLPLQRTAPQPILPGGD